MIPSGLPRPFAAPAMPRDLVQAGLLRQHGALGGLQRSRGGSASPSTGGVDRFAELLAAKIQHAHQLQSEAQAARAAVLSGQVADSATALTAAQQAEVALQTLIQIRDRLLEAYRELQQIH